MRDAKTSLLCATIVAVCASYIVWQIVDKSYKKASKSKAHQARLAKLASYLCFCENLPATIADLLKYYSFEVQKVQNEGIVATKGGVRFYVGLLLDHDFVTVAELRRVVRCAKREGTSKLIVFCLGARGTEMQLANGILPTKFVDTQGMYTLLDQADKLPPLEQPVVKKSAYFAQFAFNKKRFGGYFASGLFLLVTSALTFFPIYTIVWGTVLLGVALYSLLNKRYNVAKTVATLE